MKFNICKTFYYRVDDEDEKTLYSKFNSGSDSLFRNNKSIPLYKGEWVKIKVNDYQTYIVKPTDTIPEVAKKFGVNDDAIVGWNNLKTNRLFIGQRLKIYKHN